MSVLDVFPDDLGFLGISVHHLGEGCLGVRARETPGDHTEAGRTVAGSADTQITPQPSWKPRQD